MRSLTPSARGGREPRGQSLVEFALMAIILLVILAGLIDLGRAYFTYLALQDAAAEGAYYGQKFPERWCGDIVEPACASAPGNYATDPDNIVYRIRHSSPSGLVDWSNASISIVLAPGFQAGDSITVTVTYSYHIITPFIGAIAGSQTLTLRARQVATIITPP